MDETAVVVDDDVIDASFVDDDWPPPEPPAPESSTLEDLLDFAEALPTDAALMGFLQSIRSEPFDQAGRVRLARLWARIEAAALGYKLESVGIVEESGPESDDLLDLRDTEIATALNVGMTTARNMMAIGGTLVAKGGQVLTALRAGLLGYGHACQYAEALCGLSPEQASRVQELTLDKAPSRTPGQVRKLLRRSVARVGAEDFARKHEAAAKQAHVRVDFDNPDGMARLSGYLSAVDGAIVDKAVEAWARSAKAAGDARPLDALRAAAIVDLSERYLMGPNAPRSHGRPITVNLTYDLLTYLGFNNHPGEVLGVGAMIPADALRDLIPQAELRRIITDPMTGHLLDYGRTTYRFPPDAAAHVIATWVTSAAPGSQVAAERCDIDHGTPWDDGGPTKPDNGHPLNRRWHRWKTLGGWSVSRSGNKLTWTSPLGLTYETSPHDYRLGP